MGQISRDRLCEALEALPEGTFPLRQAEHWTFWPTQSGLLIDSIYQAYEIKSPEGSENLKEFKNDLSAFAPEEFISKWCESQTPS